MTTVDEAVPFTVPTDPINLFSSDNYKVHSLLGLSKDDLLTAVTVVDTGAGPNLIDKRILPPQVA